MGRTSGPDNQESEESTQWDQNDKVLLQQDNLKLRIGKNKMVNKM